MQVTGPLPRELHRVRAPDCTGLDVQEWGRPDGPAILFIHGGLQSQVCWHAQFDAPALADAFRLVSFDLRGHGRSDKPVGDACYRPALPWADDVAAVMTALGLQRPVMVGWSFGGRVICDYLSCHGAANVGAIAFVAGATTAAAAHFGPGLEALDRAGSADPDMRRQGTIDFLRACFHRAPPDGEFAEALDYNLAVPLHVRRSMRGRPADYDAVLRALCLPVLAIHGAEDQVLLPSLSEHTASLVPGCALRILPGIGHSPFCEDAAQFNREIAALTSRAANRNFMEVYP